MWICANCDISKTHMSTGCLELFCECLHLTPMCWQTLIQAYCSTVFELLATWNCTGNRWLIHQLWWTRSLQFFKSGQNVPNVTERPWFQKYNSNISQKAINDAGSKSDHRETVWWKSVKGFLPKKSLLLTFLLASSMWCKVLVASFITYWKYVPLYS